VAENRENVLRDLKTLVDINSVEGQPQPGAPFGPGPRKALEAALDIAAGMGLDAHNCEGYIGYADLPGASPTQIATITHLDVVPEGNGWTGSPFDMVRRDGYVVGRGVADDKGPAVLTLYAAKFFKQQGATLPYTPAPMPRRCAPRCRSWRRTRAAASCRTAPVFRSISTPIPRSSRRSSGRTTM